MSLFALQSRRFWVLFLVAALIAMVVAFQLMFNSLPVLKVDIQFSRAQAVAAAAKFQQQQFPDLHTDRSAASFVGDRELQNYVELEGGGINAFKSVINNLDAVTHYWRVRNFAESQEKELTLAFSPKGEFVSFWLKIPDQEAGAALDEAAARALAEQGAKQFMGERFSAYKAFDSDMKRQTSGRVDYIFTYEHQSLKLGEARFRIKARVAGDKLVGLDTLNHIPEAFGQRFNEMRSVNNQISQIANYLMMGLLGLGGLVGGGIWLHRRHQLHWKRGLLPAALVGSGLAAAIIANLPMSWMAYDTTVSANNFLLQQLATAGAVLVASTLFFATIYAVAEGLSRMAFADHPKLFDFFHKPVASSPEALGRVLGAYGWAGFFLLYAMVFMLISRHFGWWSPTDTETDPNILASWRPALGPIFTALQAGTWEECLFRAVPLALAAIIGKHFGIRTPLILFTLILQALIFGGAHANYPNLPGYSRLVELFIPAMAFGLVYLRFGLVVGMLTHFIYDLVLMSLPIFLSNDSSLLIDQVLVILAGLAPLLIVLWARYRVGMVLPLANEWRNGIPTEVVSEAVVEHEPAPAVKASVVMPIAINFKLWVPILLVCLVAIVMDWRKPPEIIWPKYQVNRADAKALAETELAKHGVKLAGEWHSTVLTQNGWRQPMDFVWRETDKSTFEALIGRYLDTPLWLVTWRKFDGPVEQRSEKWEAYLHADGSLHELTHTLPEGNPGAKLTREQATAKALGWIIDHQWGSANQLVEKSVEETVRPARSDWVVKYIDKAAFNQKEGQAIIRITLSGDEVTGNARTVDVPEKWSRAESERNAKKTPFNIASGLAMLVLAGLALSTFFRRHTGRKINVGVALPWIAVCTSGSLVVSMLWLDSSFSAFQPTMGWNLQLAMTLCGCLLLAVAIGVLLLFIAQAIHAERPLVGAETRSDFLLGAGIAVLFAGLFALTNLLLPSKDTPPIYSADWSTYIPWLAVIFNGFKAFLSKIFLIVFAIGSVRFLQTRIKLAIYCGLFFIMWITFSLAADEVGAAAVKQLLTLFGFVISIELVRRKQLGVLIAVMGVGVALGQASIANALYSGSWIHALLSAIGCLAVTYGLVRHWHRKSVM
jgi:hypothetical protein